MAGLVPAISMRRAQCFPYRDRRDKPGDDTRVGQGGRELIVSADEIRAALTQITIYCGAPMGVDCFRVAKPIIAEYMKNKK